MSTIGTPLLAVSVKLERTGSSNLKKKHILGNKSWVGKGAAARPANAAGPNPAWPSWSSADARLARGLQGA